MRANKEQLCVCRDCAYAPEWIVGDGEDAVPLFRAALQVRLRLRLRVRVTVRVRVS